MAGQLERAAAGGIVLAEDRVRLDTVALLIHDLRTHGIAGLHLRTTIIKARRFHFEVRRPHFFADPRLFVAVVPLEEDGTVRDFCLLLPSNAIPKLGYSETITVDPLTRRFRDYQVKSEEFGSVFLKKAFGGAAPG